MKQIPKYFFIVSTNLLLLYLVSTIGCNSSGSESKTDKDSIHITKKDTVQAAPGAAKKMNAGNLSGQLNVLTLSKDQLEILSNHNNSNNHKIVFKFYFDASNEFSPTLWAFATKKNNKFIENIAPQSLTATNQSTLNLDDFPKLLLGDQELTLKDINDFIDQVGRPSGDFKLIFSPDVKNQTVGEPGTSNGTSIENVIYYKVTLNPAKDITVPLSTKPSPPRNAQ
jgi:hypothetical protein